MRLRTYRTTRTRGTAPESFDSPVEERQEASAQRTASKAESPPMESSDAASRRIS